MIHSHFPTNNNDHNSPQPTVQPTTILYCRDFPTKQIITKTASPLFFTNMYAGAPKDNENPTIHAVEEEDDDVVGRKKRPLGWEQLKPLHVVPTSSTTTLAYEEEDGLEFFKSSADEAVAHAMMDVWEMTRGEGVSILRKAGVDIPKFNNNSAIMMKESNHNSNIGPLFVPASTMAAQRQQCQRELENIHGKRDSITSDEIFDIVRNIQDPEHAGVSLEQLRVVSRGQIEVKDSMDTAAATTDDNGLDSHLSSVTVRFTPTIPHCSMATLIGLSIRVKLMRSLPTRFKLKVFIEPGTHNSEEGVNKQLDDKERVAAALENAHLLGIVDKCIREGMMIQ